MQMLKRALIAYVNSIKAVWSKLAHPLDIVSKRKGNVKDYRIYGNSIQDGTPTPENPIEVQSVGELVTEGEYTGKYKVPVTVRGKNLFNSSQLLQAEGWGENNGEYSGEIGKLYVVFYAKGAFDVKIPISTSKICISFEGKNATKNDNTFSFRIFYTDGTSTSWKGVVNSTEWAEYRLKSEAGKTIECIKCGYNQSDTIHLRKIQITATETYEKYEPYIEPQTHNIYLDEPLKTGEVIQQSKNNLPALPQFKGTTIYEVQTEVPPSGIEVCYYE